MNGSDAIANAGSKTLTLMLGTLLLFGGCVALGLFGEREHRQHDRVSSALGELQSVLETIPGGVASNERKRLGLPLRHHEERDDDVNEFPNTTDSSVDIVGTDIVATFSDDQEAVSGETVWLRRPGVAGTKVSCVGTVPVKYLPRMCR